MSHSGQLPTAALLYFGLPKIVFSVLNPWIGVEKEDDWKNWLHFWTIDIQRWLQVLDFQQTVWHIVMVHINRWVILLWTSVRLKVLSADIDASRKKEYLKKWNEWDPQFVWSSNGWLAHFAEINCSGMRIEHEWQVVVLHAGNSSFVDSDLTYTFPNPRTC